ALAQTYFRIFFNWGKLRLKSVFGNFMKEVFPRALITVLLLLVFTDVISPVQFVYLLTAVYILRTILMMSYAFYVLPPQIGFKPPKNIDRILKYTVLILAAGLASNVLLDLDKVMISHFMTIGNVAVYA